MSVCFQCYCEVPCAPTLRVTVRWVLDGCSRNPLYSSSSSSYYYSFKLKTQFMHNSPQADNTKNL